MDERRDPVQLRDTEGVREDQHRTRTVSTIPVCTKPYLFLAFASDAKIQVEILIEHVSINKAQSSKHDLVITDGSRLKAHEQVESADVNRSARSIVHSDPPARWCGIIIKPRGSSYPSLGGPFELLNFNADDSIEVVSQLVHCCLLTAIRPEQDHIQGDEGATCFHTGDVGESSQHLSGQVLIEGIVLSVPFVPQPERDGSTGAVEEVITEREKGSCDEVTHSSLEVNGLHHPTEDHPLWGHSERT